MSGRGAAEEFSFTRQWTYESHIVGRSAAEVAAYDPDSGRVLVVNVAGRRIDLLNIASGEKVGEVAIQSGGEPNCVAVKHGLAAVAVEGEHREEPGHVEFFRAATGEQLGNVLVGALPDMLVFTPDGKKILVANEGEPTSNYRVDPEGSVSIIDLAEQPAASQVTSVGFREFDPRREELIAAGVRILAPSKSHEDGRATVAEDFEPEYIAIRPDGQLAYVSLQENNAIAEIDIAQAKITQVWPLRFKDFRRPGFGLDPSDEDPPAASKNGEKRKKGATSGIAIGNWPVWGMYEPDAIATFEAGGEVYLATANEGEMRNYKAFTDAVRVGDLGQGRWPRLDDRLIALGLRDSAALGRLKVCPQMGDRDGDGDLDDLYAFGGRSFSIWRPTATGLEHVFDSGDQLERLMEEKLPEQFNSDNQSQPSFDKRSTTKGPEPEAITIFPFRGRILALVACERISLVALYDVTIPRESRLLTYFHHRKFSGDIASGTAGDVGPECVLFIDATKNPLGEPLVVVTNEVSGTTTCWLLREGPAPDGKR